MTKKQSLYLFAGSLIYAALVRSSGGVLAYWLSWVPVILAILVILSVENNGYKKHG